jgi:hypothetical protein
MKKTLYGLLFCSGSIFAQGIQNGQLSGNFQSNSQIYFEDTDLGISSENLPSERFLTNSFANIIYSTSNFSAGMRYEANQNSLLGFDKRYNGEGITYRYAQFNKDGLDITVGNFYEQFGSGMILRAYEERNLGYDNAFDGIRLKYSPFKGVYLKSLVGKQRLYFDNAEGIVRGFDGEISLNETFGTLSEAKTQILIGGSIVSKFQKDLDPIYILPENVASWAGRFNLYHGKWILGAEYVYKYNDPSATNNFIYKEGQALLANVSYSKRGFGFSLAGKRIDNMSSNSDRNLKGQEVSINYLPALTKQHAYALATIYPYGTIANGEMGIQTELNYKVKKGSLIGGEYGMGILANFSNAYSIHKAQIDENTALGESGTLGYTSDFFKLGDEKYFQEFSLELSRKMNRKLRLTGTYINTHYNSKVIVGYDYHGMIKANIVVLEAQYKLKPKHSVRTEIQHLSTEQHEGNWAMGLIEYTVSPHYFFALQNLYNYGNETKKIHYPNVSAGYTKGTTRFALGYGKQRQGIFCVGGVCREVPKSNGISLSITSSF